MADYILLKNLDDGSIWSYKNSAWLATPLFEPLFKQNFLDYGMTDTTVIPQSAWNDFQADSVEILVWSQNEVVTGTAICVESVQPLFILNNPKLMLYKDDTTPPNVSITYTSQSTIRFGVSKDGINWYKYNGDWVQGLMTKSEFQSIPKSAWRAFFNGPAHGNDLYYKTEISTNNPKPPTVRKITTNWWGGETLILSDITIQTPEVGFRKNLQVDEQTYLLTLDDGIAFDDANIDYNLYTTPDRIKLQPLNFNTLVGGKASGVLAFEVINGYENQDYNIVLTVAKGSVGSTNVGNTHALLQDAVEDRYKTKVEMSLKLSPFTPNYPLSFRLNRGEKKTVFIKITPQLVTSGNETFQVKLVGRPL